MRVCKPMHDLASYFVSLAGNNHWSNHRLYGACACLPEDEYFMERPSFFGSIHNTLNHILIVDLGYLGRLTQTELVPLDCEELHVDFESLRRAQYETDHKLLTFCKALDHPTLASSVSFKRINNQRYTETVARVLSHLFVHQIHHRGQIHDMLAATSVAPPQLDEFFLDGDLVLRKAELEELGLPLE